MTAPETFPVYVYAENGNDRVQVHLQAGDDIEWKRNGVTGTYSGTVIKVNAKTVRLKLTRHNWSGELKTPHFCNAKSGFHKAWRNGKRVTA